MKRYLLAILLCVTVLGVMLVSMPKPLNKYIPKNANATCYVYCQQTTEQAVSVGFGCIVKCSPSELSSVIANCTGVDGVSVSFKATEAQFYNIAEKCGFTFCKEEQFAGLTTICGYSPKFCGGVVLDGNKINLQIAYSNGTVHIGSPLILGSF